MGATHRLMDYSLLVAVQACSTNGSASKGTDGEAAKVYIAIIDFLQKWTNGKRVARVIKVLECNKATIPPGSYAARFRHHFETNVKIVNTGRSNGTNSVTFMYVSEDKARADDEETVESVRVL